MIKNLTLLMAGCLSASLCSCDKQQAETALSEYEVAALAIKLPSEPEKHESPSSVLLSGALAAENEEAKDQLFEVSETYESYLEDAVVTVSHYKYKVPQHLDPEKNINEIIAELKANPQIKILQSEVTKEAFVEAPCFRGSVTYEVQGERINHEVLEFGMDNEYWKIQVQEPVSPSSTKTETRSLADRVFESLSIKKRGQDGAE